MIENIGIKDLSNMFEKTTLEEVTFNNLYKVEKISGNVFYNCDTLKKLWQTLNPQRKESELSTRRLQETEELRTILRLF